MNDPRDEWIERELREAAPPAPFPRDEIEDRIRASVARRGSQAREGASGPEDGRWGSAGAWAGRRAPQPWWRGGTARTALAAAAALVLFIGGMEYGRRMAVPAAVPGAVAGPVAAQGEASSLPLSIQSAGTEYVATLARFTGETGGMSDEQRRVTRQVALAALYGAAVELLREAGDDEMLRAVAEMVAERRGSLAGVDAPDAMSF